MIESSNRNNIEPREVQIVSKVGFNDTNSNNNRSPFLSEQLENILNKPKTENYLATVLAGGYGLSGNELTPPKFTKVLVSWQHDTE